MKVLILSCSTGGGHDSAARAIMENLKDYNIQTEIINSYNLKSKRFAKKIDDLYINIVTKRPRVFKKIYKLAELISKTRIISPVYGINKLFAKTLEEYIIEKKYDLIIATHIFPAQTLTSIKKKNPELHFLFVATDYVCIPFSREIRPDYYIIPSSLLSKSYIKCKIDKNKILPYGIPISTKFQKKYDKNVARNLLSLPKDKKIILIMSGSMGFGNIEKTINLIQNKFENEVFIVTICGNNKKLKDKLNEEYNNIIAVGFTSEINLYLDACDVVLTKPGGLTSTEIASKGVPVIFTDPIPGIENYNADFFENLNMAYVSNKNKELINYLKILLHNKHKINKMIKNQSKYINKNSTNDLVRFIIKNYMK